MDDETLRPSSEVPKSSSLGAEDCKESEKVWLRDRSTRREMNVCPVQKQRICGATSSLRRRAGRVLGMNAQASECRTWKRKAKSKVEAKREAESNFGQSKTPSRCPPCDPPSCSFSCEQPPAVSDPVQSCSISLAQAPYSL
jgi:hypothetical protein